MSSLVLRFLGPPLVERDGLAVAVKLRKAMALLAYLAVSGQRHSRDELAEMLFPHQERERGRTDLRQVLSALRETIGDRLAADRTSIWLAEGPGLRVDVHEFNRLLKEAQDAERARDPSAAERLCSEAAALVRGEFTAGFFLRDSPGFEQWQEEQREALRRKHVGALRALAALCEGRGDRTSAVGWVRRWTALEPLEEGAHRELMRLLALSGERSAALRQYDRCRELLKRELDETPSRETEELRRGIAAGRLDGGTITRRGEQPEPSRARRPGNLPSQPTSFIGRENELAAVLKALRRPDVRLLTLTGPGGTGKTRLAQEAAARLANSYEHEAWFVDLASLRDPGHFAAAVAAVLGGVYEEMAGGQSLLDVLRAYLRNRQLLLVLDNFEHLLDAAPEVADLLAACPKLKVLATSREPLRLRAEHEVPVPALELPDAGQPADDQARCEATRLFAQRASAVVPGFAATPESSPLIAEICRKLDGLPLAIELAAARVKVYPLTTMLELLEHRLRLLTGGPRDLPDRQRTMRDEIDWSYGLLDEGERSLLRRLSVFVGGCTREGAEAVCQHRAGEQRADVAEGMAALASKSLLQPMPEAGQPRYRMLQVIQEFAREEMEKSGERDGTARRFASYCLDLAERAEPYLRGPDQAAWFSRLEREYDNLRQALAWFQETGISDDGLRLAGALGWFWFRRARFSEGHDWLDRFHAAAGPQHAPGPRAKVAYFLGWMKLVVGNLFHSNPEAGVCYRESLELWREAGDRRGIALSLAALGWNVRIFHYNSRDEEAEACLTEGIAQARASGDPWTIAWCLLQTIGSWGHRDQHHTLPAATHDEALRRAEENGDPFLVCQGHLATGLARWDAGDRAGGELRMMEALRIARAIDDKWSLFESLHYIASNFLGGNQLEKAKRFYGEALRSALDAGVSSFLHWYIGGFDWIARKEGRMERAALLRAAATRRVEGDLEYLVIPGTLGPPLVIDEETDRRRWAVARSMTFDEIVEYAISDRD